MIRGEIDPMVRSCDPMMVIREEELFAISIDAVFWVYV